MIEYSRPSRMLRLISLAGALGFATLAMQVGCANEPTSPVASSASTTKPESSAPSNGAQDSTPSSAPRSSSTPNTTTMNPAADSSDAQDSRLPQSDDEWRAQLTPEQYRILRECGTEPAFRNKYWNEKRPGVYACAGCGTELFTSDAKFDSGSGWPSYWAAIDSGRITEHIDRSYGMVRIEVRCATCNGHLGHLFDDAPRTPTGMRYCINSAAMNFSPKQEGSESR